jgi:hypothetical protein
MTIAFRLWFRIRYQGGRRKQRGNGTECDTSGSGLRWDINLMGEDIQHIIKQDREAPLDASNEVGLEVNAEKTICSRTKFLPKGRQ